MLIADISPDRTIVQSDYQVLASRAFPTASHRHKHIFADGYRYLPEEAGNPANYPGSAFELAWNFAQDGKLTVDIDQAIVVDANPAMVAMMGYSREELIGMHCTELHPEDERELVRIEVRKELGRASIHHGFHLLRKDGGLVPVQVWSSEALMFAGRDMVVVEFRNISEDLQKENQLIAQKEQLEADRQNLEAAQRHLTEVLSSTVGAMVTAMETRDPYTAGHESRVADICVAIGSELGWDEDRLLGIRLAAMVHDIGKISIPAEILTKPSQLNRAEFALVKAHPETGYNILKGVPFSWPVAKIVRQHHERLDGSGYPLGINGDEILLESKVMAVADMVEAMASDRPYRRSRGLEFALGQIESEAGTTLDADVVRICAALFRENRLVVPELNWK